MSDDDVRMVADEIARMRASPDDFAKLQAELLEAAPVELAARFLRECALRALARFEGRGEPWQVSAILQAAAHSEWRRRRRLAGPKRPLP